MSESHLEGLTLAEKRLTKAYSTSILGGVRTITDVTPVKLKPYVELEIAEREIAALT